MPRELVVLLDGRVAGTLVRSPLDGALTFTYDDAWRADREAYALSLSLPLAGRSFTGPTVRFYLQGLLSDDPGRLARIAARHGVSPSDPFALLAWIGEDCPGAVQFARPDRVDALLGAGPGEVVWMSDEEVADHLRALPAENSGLEAPEEEGRFSLPGALAKIALRWD